MVRVTPPNSVEWRHSSLLDGSSPSWMLSPRRNVFLDLEEICGAVSPEVGRVAPYIRIWDSKAPFRLGPLDDPAMLRPDDFAGLQDFLGETHEDFATRLTDQSRR